jgi:hypothetical protein
VPGGPPKRPWATKGDVAVLSERLVRSLAVALLSLSVAAPTPARAAEPGRDASAGAIDRFVQGWMAT